MKLYLSKKKKNDYLLKEWIGVKWTDVDWKRHCFPWPQLLLESHDHSKNLLVLLWCKRNLFLICTNCKIWGKILAWHLIGHWILPFRLITMRISMDLVAFIDAMSSDSTMTTHKPFFPFVFGVLCTKVPNFYSKGSGFNKRSSWMSNWSLSLFLWRDGNGSIS